MTYDRLHIIHDMTKEENNVSSKIWHEAGKETTVIKNSVLEVRGSPWEQSVGTNKKCRNHTCISQPFCLANNRKY